QSVSAVATETVLKMPLDPILKLIPEGNLDDACLDQDLAGHYVKLTQSCFDLAIFPARCIDQQGVVVLISNNADIFTYCKAAPSGSTAACIGHITATATPSTTCT